VLLRCADFHLRSPCVIPRLAAWIWLLQHPCTPLLVLSLLQTQGPSGAADNGAATDADAHHDSEEVRAVCCGVALGLVLHRFDAGHLIGVEMRVRASMLSL